MKTHYRRPFTILSLCRKEGDITDDHTLVTCLQCISRMSPGEQMWHEQHNQEWIEHCALDRRRKGIKETMTMLGKAGSNGAKAGQALRQSIDDMSDKNTIGGKTTAVPMFDHYHGDWTDRYKVKRRSVTFWLALCVVLSVIVLLYV